MERYYCQGDGAQWNVKVEIVYSLVGLHVVCTNDPDFRSLGCIGSDGNTYALVPDCDLHDKPQP